MESMFDNIRSAVEKELSCSAHQMDHVMRVYNLAMTIAEGEASAGSDIDLDILKAAVLLHDIARVKEDDDDSGSTDHAVLGAKMAVPILESVGFPEEKIPKVQHCIVAHRYKTDNKPESEEAKILFDADKLDTLGAIGIARAYVWIGVNKARIYRKPDIEEYMKENLGGKINGRIQDNSKHSVQIEYEVKTKFLEKKLFTDKAKDICKERLAFYSSFLNKLEDEIQGKG